MEKEFTSLVAKTEHWNDDIAGAIINVKAFEDDVKLIETRYCRLRHQNTFLWFKT